MGIKVSQNVALLQVFSFNQSTKNFTKILGFAPLSFLSVQFNWKRTKNYL